MGVKFANNAYGTLNASITNTDTSLTLSSGQGARFPSLGAGDYFYVTLIDTSNNLEIAKCTARSSDVLTITRGQEGTTARSYSVGDRVELRITGQSLVDATAYDAVLPSQTGNSGEFLTTNGSTASWAALPPSNDASALTTGTLSNARLDGGVPIQYKFFKTTSVYDNTTQGSWNNLPSPLGDGTAAITMSNASNDIILRYAIHGGHQETWRSHMFRASYKIGSGSWNVLTGGGSTDTTYVSGAHTMGNSSICEVFVEGLNTTSTVYFKVEWFGHPNGGYIHMNQTNTSSSTADSNSNSQASWISLTEVQQ